MQKRIPLRQCIGCRTMMPKSEIIRVSKSPEGVISLDTSGKNPGRGAYICKNTQCLKRVIKSNALNRAFKTQIPECIINQLQEQLENNEASNGS